MSTTVAVGRAAVDFVEARLLPEPVCMVVRRGLQGRLGVRLTLSVASAAAHLCDIAEYATALELSHVTVIRTQTGVELVAEAALPCGAPIRVTAITLFAAADAVVAELGLDEWESATLSVAALRDLAATLERTLAAPAEYSSAPVDDERATEDDTVTLTIPSEVVAEALGDTREWAMPDEIAAATRHQLLDDESTTEGQVLTDAAAEVGR
jgi:hypothetical protein